MLTARLPGMQPEVFDNIAGNSAAFWQSLANAVNTGAGVQRSASRVITVQPNGNTSTPSSFSLALGSTTLGSDGAAGVGPAQLVGQDGTSRTGMYPYEDKGVDWRYLPMPMPPRPGWTRRRSVSKRGPISFLRASKMHFGCGYRQTVRWTGLLR